MKTYMPRIADQVLRDRLRSAGAVLIRGPKWCGKTTTALQIAASEIRLDDPVNGPAFVELVDTDPMALLAGPVPRLLDEWQLAPRIWDAVRYAVDQRQEDGQFILTGSAVPRDDVTRHTGTGRFAFMTMRPMSLYESGESSGAVSLNDLFSGSFPGMVNGELSISELASVIARGGWPRSVGSTEKEARRRVMNYVDAVVNSDVSRVDGTPRDPARVGALLRSIARSISQPASLQTLRADTAGDPDVNVLATSTVEAYLAALQRIYVVEDLRAWSPPLRSSTPVRSTPKRLFVDPSIALAVLGLSADVLTKDFQYYGFLFEAMCIRDLRVYADALDGSVYYYRDKTDLEADAVLVLPDRRWAAIEIKLGQKGIEAGAASLRKFADRVDTDVLGTPSFLMVLTGGQTGYRRKDGVYVVPITALGP